MTRRSPTATLVLTVLAGLLLAAGGTLAYVRAEIVREDAFSERLVSALDDDAVRELVVERTVDALVNASSGDLLAIRPLATGAIDSLVVTGAFRNLAALGVREAHRALVDEDGSLVVELGRGGPALLDALRSVSPAAAAQIPGNVTPLFGELEPGEVELGAARVLLDLSRWWWLVVAAALAAGGAALALSGDWRRALGGLGVAVAGGSALVAAAVTLAGAGVVAHLGTVAGLEDDRAREALSGVWWALFGDLRTAALLVGAGGLVVAAVTSGLVRAPEPGGRLAGWIRRARRLPAWVGSVALVAAGLACLLAPGAVLTAFTLLVGAALLYLGAADIASRLAAGAPADRRRARRGLVAGIAALTALAAATAAALVALNPPALPQPASAAPRAGCNGSRPLCNRRLNEVVFAGTHNSYAAADEPGWLFANQRFGIARQLRDGIRALLIDVHWGVLDEDTGRVRTDIDADGQTRNKIAQELSPEALRTADRIAGEVGAGELGGTPRPFLCHGLCELGAEPLDQELTVIRRFLEREPIEVLLLIVEDYVPPEEIERSMRRTGLLRYAAELDRDEPLPTLGELVRSGKRLVILAEDDGGSPRGTCRPSRSSRTPRSGRGRPASLPAPASVATRTARSSS